MLHIRIAKLWQKNNKQGPNYILKLQRITLLVSVDKYGKFQSKHQPFRLFVYQYFTKNFVPPKKIIS